MTIKNIPVGYKDSPLGIIPQEWEVKRLGELSEINPSKGEITSKFVTFLAMSDISEQGRVMNENIVSTDSIKSGFTPFKRNDIIVAKITPCFENGKGALLNNITEEYGFGSTEFHVIRCQQCNRFIYYHTISYPFRKRLESQMTGSAGQKRVSADSISSYKIPLPPLAEQEKIAEILSTWDKAIDKQTQLIEKLELRKKGLMQQLLTGKKRLPGFTGEWKKVKAGLIFKSVSIRSNKQDILLSATQEHGVIPRDMLESRVTMPTGDLSSFKLVDVGDFVISLRSFEGGIEYSQYRGVVSPAYTVLKKALDVNSAFYKAYFKSNDFIQRLSVAVIGIRDGKQISYSDFAYIKIPFPALQEQTAIANILSSCDEEIRLAQDKLAAMKEQKKGLMQVLLTGKKRVKI